MGMGKKCGGGRSASRLSTPPEGGDLCVLLRSVCVAWRRIGFLTSEAMKPMSRRRSRNEFPDLAAEPGPEDGTDAKEFHRKPWDAPKSAGRKALQLCGQVKEALHSALAGCGDGVLQALTVVSVEPAPNTGRLRVVVAMPTDEGGPTPAVVAQHLHRAAGMLRHEVATAINRRYAPELAFDVIG